MRHSSSSSLLEQAIAHLEKGFHERRNRLPFPSCGFTKLEQRNDFHYLNRMQLEPTPSFELQSVDLMFEEMDQAGIALGVIGVPGPTGIRGLDPVGGDAVSGLVEQHPERFVIFGAVEPSDIESAARSIKEMGQAGIKGVTIDPSTAHVHRQFHDRFVSAIRRSLRTRNVDHHDSKLFVGSFHGGLSSRIC
ncbi:MAG: hypothetical protein Ct9H300mP26_3170 [Acidimicrobiales bacterium]|nr:MAG: hypothetical protein Ct9H300mP26_3170 [Acidimicrobiales bacterium]